MNRIPPHGPSRRTALAALVVTGLAGTLGHAVAQTELTDLARIKASGALKVAVYKDNAPFSDGPANAVTGLDVSIAEALATRMGLRLALLPFDAGENMNDDLRNMVWRGHYLGYGPADVMMQVPVDRYLMQRNRQVIVLAPYMRQQLVLAHDTRKIADVQSADDLKGQALAAQRGAAAASALFCASRHCSMVDSCSGQCNLSGIRSDASTQYMTTRVCTSGDSSLIWEQEVMTKPCI